MTAIQIKSQGPNPLPQLHPHPEEEPGDFDEFSIMIMMFLKNSLQNSDWEFAKSYHTSGDALEGPWHVLGLHLADADDHSPGEVLCPRNLPWNDKSPCSWSSPFPWSSPCSWSFPWNDMISLFRNFYLKPVFPPPLLSSPRRRCRQCNDTLIPGLFPFLGSWNSQRLQIHERVQLKSESCREKKKSFL